MTTMTTTTTAAAAELLVLPSSASSKKLIYTSNENVSPAAVDGSTSVSTSFVDSNTRRSNVGRIQAVDDYTNNRHSIINETDDYTTYKSIQFDVLSSIHNPNTVCTNTSDSMDDIQQIFSIEKINSTINSFFIDTDTGSDTANKSSAHRPDRNCDWKDITLHRPCVSARIFSCFILWFDLCYNCYTNNEHETSDPWKTYLNDKTISENKIQLFSLLESILPFITAMVQIEALTLEESEYNEPGNTIQPNIHHTTEITNNNQLIHSDDNINLSSSTNQKSPRKGKRKVPLIDMTGITTTNNGTFNIATTAIPTHSSNNTILVNENKKPKKVHFLSFIGSSIRPPIDRDLHSGIRQHQLLHHMITTKQIMETVLKRKNTNNNIGTTNHHCNEKSTTTTTNHVFSIEQLLEYLLYFLNSLLQATKTSITCDSETNHRTKVYEYFKFIVHQCIRSISKENDTTNLVITTIQLLQQDIQILLHRYQVILQQQETNELNAVVTTIQKPVLQYEIRLMELLGQGIRYRLRVLFNPCPPRLCNIDTQYNERSLLYSKVHEYMQISSSKYTIQNNIKQGKDRNLAIDDGFISALISRTLLKLYEYFGLSNLIHPMPNSNDITDGPAIQLEHEIQSVLPKTFCSSVASMRPLPKRFRLKDEVITKSERDDIIHDIQMATSFICTTYAVRFLYDLFSSSTVHDEIIRMGGWSDIEQYATACYKYQLYSLNDIHFLPLQNISNFIQLLSVYCTNMEQKMPSCVKALQLVETNYHLSMLSLQDMNHNTVMHKKYHPYIVEIMSVYTEQMNAIYTIPVIQENVNK